MARKWSVVLCYTSSTNILDLEVKVTDLRTLGKVSPRKTLNLLNILVWQIHSRPDVRYWSEVLCLRNRSH